MDYGWRLTYKIMEILVIIMFFVLGIALGVTGTLKTIYRNYKVIKREIPLPRR